MNQTFIANKTQRDLFKNHSLAYVQFCYQSSVKAICVVMRWAYLFILYKELNPGRISGPGGWNIFLEVTDKHFGFVTVDTEKRDMYEYLL